MVGVLYYTEKKPLVYKGWKTETLDYLKTLNCSIVDRPEPFRIPQNSCGYLLPSVRCCCCWVHKGPFLGSNIRLNFCIVWWVCACAGGEFLILLNICYKHTHTTPPHTQSVRLWYLSEELYTLGVVMYYTRKGDFAHIHA